MIPPLRPANKEETTSHGFPGRYSAVRTSLAEGLAVRHEDGPCSVEYSLYTFKFKKGLSGLKRVCVTRFI